MTANNVTPVYLYVYVSKDNSNFVKTQYCLTINQGDTTGCLLNCVTNSPYIKLSGENVTGLSLPNFIQICMSY